MVYLYISLLKLKSVKWMGRAEDRQTNATGKNVPLCYRCVGHLLYDLKTLCSTVVRGTMTEQNRENGDKLCPYSIRETIIGGNRENGCMSGTARRERRLHHSAFRRNSLGVFLGTTRFRFDPIIIYTKEHGIYSSAGVFR